MKIKTVHILIFVLATLLSIGGSYTFVSYQSKERETQALLTDQQKALQEANQKIAGLQSKVSTNPLVSQSNTQGNPNENTDYSTLVAQWENHVAQVTCSWNYSNGTTYQADEASALLVDITGVGFTAVTNNHVITDSNGNAPSTCTVGVYGLGTRTVQYRPSPLDPFSRDSAGGDWAYIKLDDKYLASQTGNGMFNTNPNLNYSLRVCSASDAMVGDKLIVLGYPAIGTSGGITVTEGIVSGLESNDYVTSAKIDHGNSGGVAVLVKNNCYLGIPTWVANNGGFESLGRILKGTLVFPSELKYF